MVQQDIVINVDLPVPDSDETPNVYSPSPENCVICLVNKREVAYTLWA